MLRRNVGVSAFDQAGGFGAFWAYQEPAEFFPIYAERFASISFGNRKNPEGSIISKVEAYMVMSSFLNYLRKWQQMNTFSGLQLAG